jgi:hypothetical protein
MLSDHPKQFNGDRCRALTPWSVENLRRANGVKAKEQGPLQTGMESGAP